MNLFLKFYENLKISPVSQDISDFQKHVARRTALYRQLGLLPLTFRNAEVLEVGPGSGHNSIVTAGFKPRRLVLVEPNSTGFQAVTALFRDFTDIPIEIHHALLENYAEPGLFDIVLCEGLVPGLDHKEAFLDQLDARVTPGGVLVITCYDSVSILFESLRRLIGKILIRDVVGIEDRINILTQAFGSHLASLKGMTRSPRDWVLDNLLAPPVFNVKDYFSVGQAISFFADRYYFYQSSPSFLSNYAWYKELSSEPSEFNHNYIDQFRANQHNLIHYQQESLSPRAGELNIELEKGCSELAGLAQQDMIEAGVVVSLLERIRRNLGQHMLATAALNEVMALFESGEFIPEKIAVDYPAFRAAFGRGQQYVSLLKVGG